MNIETGMCKTAEMYEWHFSNFMDSSIKSGKRIRVSIVTDDKKNQYPAGIMLDKSLNAYDLLSFKSEISRIIEEKSICIIAAFDMNEVLWKAYTLYVVVSD